MKLWFEITNVALSGIAGFGLGYLSSRLPKHWWMLGYFIPMLLIAVYGVAVHDPSLLASTSALSWMFVGRNKFFVLSFVAAMVLATPLFRLPQKRDRRFIILLVVVAIFASSAWPFLAPMFNRHELEHLETRINVQGICLQNTGYTCGPAAAVTVLRRLGLPAEEGEIAVLSQTSSSTGTPPDLLAEALRQRYGKDGLVAEYRNFKNLAELRRAGLTLAVVRFSFMVDHYVAVLSVTDSAVTIGDPLNGLETLSPQEFYEQWRYCGVVLQKH